MSSYIKRLILNLASIPHVVVILWRLINEETNVFRDRPLWYVKSMCYYLKSADIDLKDETQVIVLHMTREAIKELHLRDRQEDLKLGH
jgi:hypothetical protein